MPSILENRFMQIGMQPHLGSHTIMKQRRILLEVARSSFCVFCQLAPKLLYKKAELALNLQKERRSSHSSVLNSPRITIVARNLVCISMYSYLMFLRFTFYISVRKKNIKTSSLFNLLSKALRID